MTYKYIKQVEIIRESVRVFGYYPFGLEKELGLNKNTLRQAYYHLLEREELGKRRKNIGVFELTMLTRPKKQIGTTNERARLERDYMPFYIYFTGGKIDGLTCPEDIPILRFNKGKEYMSINLLKSDYDLKYDSQNFVLLKGLLKTPRETCGVYLIKSTGYKAPINKIQYTTQETIKQLRNKQVINSDFKQLFLCEDNKTKAQVETRNSINKLPNSEIVIVSDWMYSNISSDEQYRYKQNKTYEKALEKLLKLFGYVLNEVLESEEINSAMANWFKENKTGLDLNELELTNSELSNSLPGLIAYSKIDRLPKHISIKDILKQILLVSENEVDGDSLFKDTTKFTIETRKNAIFKGRRTSACVILRNKKNAYVVYPFLVWKSGELGMGNEDLRITNGDKTLVKELRASGVKANAVLAVTPRHKDLDKQGINQVGNAKAELGKLYGDKRTTIKYLFDIGKLTGENK